MDTTLCFDGTFDGFLCAVHAYYYQKLRPSRVIDRDSPIIQQDLFGNVINIETDLEKSVTVSQALIKKASMEVYQDVYFAFLGSEPERFLHILNYVVLAFKQGHKVNRFEQYDFVRQVRKLALFTGREAHLLKGFLRFVQANGFLYGKIGPKNNVLPILADHFSDRLRYEAWLIHDENREQAVIYKSDRWVIIPLPKDFSPEITEDEPVIGELWKKFHQSIAVEHRINPKLQRNMLPKRYRPYMTEFENPELPNDLSVDLPKGLPNDLPKGLPNDLPKGLPNDLLNDLPHDLPHDLPKE